MREMTSKKVHFDVVGSVDMSWFGQNIVMAVDSSDVQCATTTQN